MARYIKRGKVWQYEISYKDTDGKYKKLTKGFYTVRQDILLTDHFKQW